MSDRPPENRSDLADTAAVGPGACAAPPAPRGLLRPERGEGGFLRRDRTTAIVRATDLTATAVFAVEGSLAGAAAGLNLVGVLVLGFLTAVGGGIVRDLLLGDTPPAALRSKTYPIVIGVSLLAAVVLNSAPGPISSDLLVLLDAGGLGLFAATGAAKALEHRCHAWVAVMLGTITGCGGGVLRDLVLGRPPLALTGNLYATAAAAGSLLVVVLDRRSRTLAVALGIGVCVVLRLLAVELGWTLEPPTF